MAPSFATKEQSRLARELILTELTSGVKTTEELRIAIREDRNYLYNQLNALVAADLIESNHPKLRNTMKKWRLKRNPTTPG